jgi:hypothetical protein
MATWATVSRLARALPDVVESQTKGGLLQWRVKDKLLAWDRPLRRSDLAALGEEAPKGAILGVFVPDLETKDILVTQRSQIYFTTPHFKGYAIVLVRLGKIPAGELKALLAEGWEARRTKPKARAKRKA